MTHRPVCACDFCGDWFDVWVEPGERVCDACLEMLEISHDDLLAMSLVERGREGDGVDGLALHGRADRRSESC